MKHFSRIMVVVLTVSMAIAGLIGCQKNAEPPAVTTEQPPASMFEVKPPETAPPTQTEENPVVVIVNGEEIRRDEVSRRMSMMMREGRQPNLAQAVDQILAHHLIVQEAKRAGMTPTDMEIQEAFDELVGQIGGEQVLQQELARAGTTVEDVKKNLKDQLTVQKMIDHVLAESSEVTDQSVEDFYSENTELFKHPELVKARHILIRSDASDSEEEKAAARSKIEEIQKRIQAGEDFSEIARAESDDPGSAANGGDLGAFPKGRMVKPFEDAAFDLEAGQTSSIVETQFGFHLIKVDERIPEGVSSLDEVRDRLKEHLRDQQDDSLVSNWLEGLREKAKIEYVDKSLAPANAGQPGF